MFKYFKYMNINSIIHSLNPFLKLLITICYIVSTFLAKSLFAYLFLMAFLLIVLIFSYIPDFKYYEHIYDYKFLILLTLLIDLIVNFSLKSLILTLVSAIFSTLIFGAFIFTTKPRDLFISLETFFWPLSLFGVNTKELSFKIISLAIYKKVFFEEKKLLDKETKNQNMTIKFLDKVKIIHQNALSKINKLNETMIVRNYFVFKKDAYKVSFKTYDCLFAITELVLLIAVIVRG